MAVARALEVWGPPAPRPVRRLGRPPNAERLACSPAPVAAARADGEALNRCYRMLTIAVLARALEDLEHPPRGPEPGITWGGKQRTWSRHQRCAYQRWSRWQHRARRWQSARRFLLTELWRDGSVWGAWLEELLDRRRVQAAVAARLAGAGRV